MTEPPPPSPLGDLSNVLVDRTPSPHKRKHVDDVGDNHEHPARQKGLKGAGLQFGSAEPIDMADGKADGKADG